MKKAQTRTVCIGGSGKTERTEIGGNAPISIQTMWKEGIVPVLTDNSALFSLADKIEQLGALGCRILRFAVPDMQSADALCRLAEHVRMPLVADIHFDWRLALRCLKGNVAKIRINPGNIGSAERVSEVVNACKDKGVAVRIGVNAGSFPSDIASAVEKGKMSRFQGLCETAVREAAVFEKLNFDQYVVSLKASSIEETIQANEAFAKQCPAVPLPIGVTEAGPLIGGIVKSTVAFTHLLKEGIGSTIRVSLSSDVENEVIAAREILAACGLYTGGVKIVSCPRCGRNGFDVHGFVKRWQNKLLSMNKNITVAVMGCVVNGPGEGKHADIGITGAGNSVLIFKKGKVVRTLQNDDLNILSKNADIAFSEEIKSL